MYGQEFDECSGQMRHIQFSTKLVSSSYSYSLLHGIYETTTMGLAGRTMGHKSTSQLCCPSQVILRFDVDP